MEVVNLTLKKSIVIFTTLNRLGAVKLKLAKEKFPLPILNNLGSLKSIL
jgi:hypothetical protein